MNSSKQYLKVVFIIASLMLYCHSHAKELNFITIDLNGWAKVDQVTGKVVGVFADIVSAIEKKTDFEINISLAPYVRVNRELEAGRQDCTILVRDEERTKLTLAGENVLNIPVGVVAAKNKKLKEYNDLYGLQLSYS